MPISRESLVRNFAAAMHEGDAALFVGAGLSQPAGFVNWKGLLKDCAEELGLDVEQEHDLVAVAQYYLNKRNRDRSRLNQILRDYFDKSGTPSDSHKIIARLPLSIVWTSNFDTLLEDHYEKAGKVVDVKSDDKQVGTSLRNRDVIVYKMHGDIARPDEVIISKDDYERYAIRHKIFQNALEGDLLQKNFLFLGFSFTDPHLEYMLGHLRALLEDSKREHYTIMRKVSRDDYGRDAGATKQYRYALNRQALQIDDLQRYSIQTLLVDKYTEVPKVLEEIESYYYYKNIFVSGSADVFAGRFSEDRTRELCYQLGKQLVEKGYNLVSGFGLNVGSAVVVGALEKLYTKKHPAVEKRIWLRPFPQKQLPKDELEQFNRKHREDMLSKCGFAIFIAGNKKDYPEAPGVLQEYEIVKQFGRIPVPIGATGYAAAYIWKDALANHSSIYGRSVPKSLLQKLGNPSLTNSEIIDSVFKVIQAVNR